jgi:hypothetical protein
LPRFFLLVLPFFDQKIPFPAIDFGEGEGIDFGEVLVQVFGQTVSKQPVGIGF